MAVYYKFKSAKDYDSIAIDGHFITVLNLKEKIFETKHLGRGTDFDLVVTNAQTNEEYHDETMLIPKNTSVLIRRVPGRPRMPIVTQQDEPNVEASKLEEAQPTNSNYPGAGSSAMKYPDESEWDEFGSDLYAIPEALPVHISNPVQDVPPPSKADEDSKIQALIDTPALDWQHQTDGFGTGRGYGRGMGGRMMGGRGFGRGGFERRTPPPGYVCYRCNQPGHYIQHCPTNGIPEYDVKRVKPPTGIPKSMLMPTAEGSYVLPSGAVAVLKPNEAAFEKEIEGVPSSRTVGDLPPELHCPLCKQVMKDAVLTSKCCFTSFCDKCIRDHIINKSMCVCGANHVLADDLLPNKTLRDTINRILESNNNSSTENGGSAFQIQDMESKMSNPRKEQKVPSPTHFEASKGNKVQPPQTEESSKVGEAAGQDTVLPACQTATENGRREKAPDVSEATRDSATVKEHGSQGSAPLADDEVQQKPESGDAGKKKKKKKVRAPFNDMQWRNPQDFGMENYMMPMGPSAYDPYWNGMQPGMGGFVPPFGGPMPPFMGYGPGPMDVPFGVMPPDPFGVPNMMMPPPFPPQRDLAEMVMGTGMGMRMGMGMGMGMGRGMNGGPPVMSREEFEARKADLRRKRENETKGESRDYSRDREFSREISSNKPLPPPSTEDHSRHRHRSDRPSLPLDNIRHRSEWPSPPTDRSAHDADLHRPSSKRKSSEYELDYDCPSSKRKSSEYELNYDRPSSKRKSSEYELDYDRPSSKRKLSDYDPKYDRPSSKHNSSSHELDYDHHRRHDHHQSGPSTRSPSLEDPPLAKSAAAVAADEADRKRKSSVFSRISFPAGEDGAKKRKSSSSEVAPLVPPPVGRGSSSGHKNNGYYDDRRKTSAAVKRTSVEVYEESSEDEEDRHFKRRPARYESSPALAEERDDRWDSRGARDRERERRHR